MEKELFKEIGLEWAPAKSEISLEKSIDWATIYNIRDKRAASPLREDLMIDRFLIGCLASAGTLRITDPERLDHQLETNGYFPEKDSFFFEHIELVYIVNSETIKARMKPFDWEKLLQTGELHRLANIFYPKYKIERLFAPEQANNKLDAALTKELNNVAFTINHFDQLLKKGIDEKVKIRISEKFKENAVM